MTSVDNVALKNLRRDGQRLTTGRQLLLQTLAEAAEPMTIPMILEAQPLLAQSSVYRNLGVLASAGLVSRVSLGEERCHFELSEEVTGVHHHHQLCTECGAANVVTLPAAVEARLCRDLDKAAQPTSFRVTGHRLDLIGVCANCATVA